MDFSPNSSKAAFKGKFGALLKIFIKMLRIRYYLAILSLLGLSKNTGSNNDVFFTPLSFRFL